MKKFLSLVVVAGFLAASIGCDDKKTSPPAAKAATTAAGAPAPTAPAAK